MARRNVRVDRPTILLASASDRYCGNVACALGMVASNGS